MRTTEAPLKDRQTCPFQKIKLLPVYILGKLTSESRMLTQGFEGEDVCDSSVELKQATL